MASLGLKLRQERERLGIPLADIARETRISVRYLDAIESEDTRTLPHDFFYRSFVRQYAEYLGISADEVTASLRREMPEPEVVLATPAPAPKVIPALVNSLPAVSLPSAPISSSFEDSRTSKRWLAVAALLLVGSVSYLATRQPNALSGETPATVAQSEAPATNSPAPQPVAPVSAPSASVPIVQATDLGSGRLQIVISAREQTWIKLVADGKNIFMGLIEPGQSQAIQNASNAELLTGNAGGIEVKQNGRPLPGLGSSGEVRTVLFDSENYQVRQPVIKQRASDPAADSAEPAKPAPSTSSTD